MRKEQIDNILTLRKWALTCENPLQLEGIEDDLYNRRAKVLKNYNLSSKEVEELETNVQKVLRAISTMKTLL